MSRKLGMTLLTVSVLVLAMLACGGEDATPEKVGEVATSPPQPTSTSAPEAPPPTEVPAPTEAPPPTEVPAPTEAPPPGPTTYQVGDIISIGDMLLVVLGWDFHPGDDFVEPDEGKQFVGVDIVLVNQSDDTTSVSSLLQMGLKDDTDQRYEIDLMAEAASGISSPDGEIAPGERVRGEASFQIPEGVGGLTFVFDADIWGGGKTFVNLGAQPVTVEVPADLPGERAQQVFALGDMVQIGDFTIVINEVTNPPGDEFTKPEEGNTYVVVDVSVTNNGSESENLSSLLQMSLKDSSGQVYELDLMASVASGGTTPDGEIAAGETIRGQVGYQVPQNATGLVFVFDADVWGAGKVFVALP